MHAVIFGLTPDAHRAAIGQIAAGGKAGNVGCELHPASSNVRSANSRFMMLRYDNDDTKQRATIIAALVKPFTATRLLNGVFQCFTRNECRYVCSSNFDFFASLRVAASALSTVVNFKSTKTNQLYSITIFQRLGNCSRWIPAQL